MLKSARRGWWSIKEFKQQWKKKQMFQVEQVKLQQSITKHAADTLEYDDENGLIKRKPVAFNEILLF